MVVMVLGCWCGRVTVNPLAPWLARTLSSLIKMEDSTQAAGSLPEGFQARDLAGIHAEQLRQQLVSLLVLPPEVKIRALLLEAAEEATFGLVEGPANQHADVVARLRAGHGERLAAKRKKLVAALVSLVQELETVLAGSR